MDGFQVQTKMCATCIYRPGSPLDVALLESEIADGYGGFRGHRVCHHSDNVCCAGFWQRHKDSFPVGQIAQRLDLVQFVSVDTMKPLSESRLMPHVAPAPRVSTEITAHIADGELILRIPIIPTADLKPSTSGKNILIASTRGNVVIPGFEYKYQGRRVPIVLGVNAYIPVDSGVSSS